MSQKRKFHDHKYDSKFTKIRITKVLHQEIMTFQASQKDRFSTVPKLIEHIWESYPPNIPQVSFMIDKLGCDSWEDFIQYLSRNFPIRARRNSIASSRMSDSSQCEGEVLYNFYTETEDDENRLHDAIIYRRLRNECNVSLTKLPLIVLYANLLKTKEFISSKSISTFIKELGDRDILTLKTIFGEKQKNAHLSIDSSTYQTKERMHCMINYWDKVPTRKLFLSRSLPGKHSQIQFETLMEGMELICKDDSTIKNILGYVISDCAADIVGNKNGLIKLLQNHIGKNICHIPCDLHVLNRAFILGIRAAFGSDSKGKDGAFGSSSFMNLCKEISKFIRKNWKKFKPTFLEYSDENVEIIPSPVATRWFSVFNTINWIISYRQPLSSCIKEYYSKIRLLKTRQRYIKMEEELMTRTFFSRLLFIKEFGKEFLQRELIWSVERDEARKFTPGFRSAEMPLQSVKRYVTLEFLQRSLPEEILYESDLSEETKNLLNIEYSSFFTAFIEYWWKYSGKVWLCFPTLMFAFGGMFDVKGRIISLERRDKLFYTEFLKTLHLGLISKKDLEISNDIISTDTILEKNILPLEMLSVTRNNTVNDSKTDWWNVIESVMRWNSRYITDFSTSQIPYCFLSEDILERLINGIKRYGKVQENCAVLDKNILKYVKNNIWCVPHQQQALESTFSVLNHTLNMANGAWMNEDTLETSQFDRFNNIIPRRERYGSRITKSAIAKLTESLAEERRNYSFC